MTRLGLLLSQSAVEARERITRRAGARENVRLPWNADAPEEIVERLREQFGAVSEISITIALDLLHVTRATLPPVPLEARWRIVSLEPDRYFAVRAPLSVALGDDSGLAFGVETARLARWIEAFERWAPIASIEPGAITASAATAGAITASAATADAIHGVEAPLPRMLLTPALAARITARRRSRLWRAALAVAAALALLVWSADFSRARLLSRLDAEIARAAPRAAPAEAVQARLAGMEREHAAVALANGASASVADPLTVLAALGERLPHDATALSVKSSGNEWQVDGTASNASGIVPALDADPRFEHVRILSASSRFRDGERQRETFSVGFRLAHSLATRTAEK